MRIFVKDASQHVSLKSLSNVVLFKDTQDYEYFTEIIKELVTNHAVNLHAYVMMPEYFEFVATPTYVDALPKFMQSLGRKYVAYYNKKYNRTGTLWDGRYKASVVEDKHYLFDVMHYIENLAPESYAYSSIWKNLYNKTDAIVTLHKLYKDLAYNDDQRVAKYAALCHLYSDEKEQFIKESLQKQRITGTPEFIKEIEKKLGILLTAKERGRPKKQKTKQRKKMYKNLIVLDKAQHKDLKLNPLKDLLFAKDTAFIPVVASEVAQIGTSFPVVFTADETPSLVTLVSLGGDNLAITGEGKWITPYVPSYLRKYPFSLAGTKENPEQKVILIDEDSGLFSKTKGKQLFKKDGSQSEILSNAIKFLTAQENNTIITSNVAKVIAQSDILEDREISVGEGEEKKVLVNGFKVVNREKLNALSDDILADWVRKGIITLIDAHLKSLDNIQTLFNLAQARQK